MVVSQRKKKKREDGCDVKLIILSLEITEEKITVVLKVAQSRKLKEIKGL